MFEFFYTKEYAILCMVIFTAFALIYFNFKGLRSSSKKYSSCPSSWKIALILLILGTALTMGFRNVKF